jgi:hypothetical protein
MTNDGNYLKKLRLAWTAAALTGAICPDVTASPWQSKLYTHPPGTVGSRLNDSSPGEQVGFVTTPTGTGFYSKPGLWRNGGHEFVDLTPPGLTAGAALAATAGQQGGYVVASAISSATCGSDVERLGVELR